MATSAQARRWAKTGATQRRILDAATEVFATRGFTVATMADVVAASAGDPESWLASRSELRRLDRKGIVALIAARSGSRSRRNGMVVLVVGQVFAGLQVPL